MAIDIFERLPDGTKVKVKDTTDWGCTKLGEIVEIINSEKDAVFESDGWCYDIKEGGCVWASDIECIFEDFKWVNKGSPKEFPESDMAQEIERLEGINKFLLAKGKELSGENNELKSSLLLLDKAYIDLGRDHVNSMLENISYVDMVNEKLDLFDRHIEQLNLQVENQIKLRDYWLNSLENLNWFQKLIIGYDTIKRDYCRLRITLPKNPIIRRESGGAEPNAGSDTATTSEEKAKYEEGNGTGY